MPNSYSGKILHVDLTEEKWWVEELPESIYRKYLGGGALATYFMLRDMKPGDRPAGAGQPAHLYDQRHQRPAPLRRKPL